MHFFNFFSIKNENLIFRMNFWRKKCANLLCGCVWKSAFFVWAFVLSVWFNFSFNVLVHDFSSPVWWSFKNRTHLKCWFFVNFFWHRGKCIYDCMSEWLGEIVCLHVCMYLFLFNLIDSFSVELDFHDFWVSLAIY